MSGKIPAEQVHTRLSQALNELQGLRNNSSIPEALLDIWENKFNCWLSELSNNRKHYLCQTPDVNISHIMNV